MYIKRLIDPIIERKLKSSSGVVIQGLFGCGKTTTCLTLAKSSIMLSSPKELKDAMFLLDLDPDKFLTRTYPLLIDEWQLIPSIYDEIRTKIDRENKSGLFLLTGSMLPVNKKKDILHTGVGRFSYVTIRSFSLYESGDSSGQVSLSDLFETFSGQENSSSSKQMMQDTFINIENPFDIDKISYLICRGGFPRVVLLSKENEYQASLDISKDYYHTLINNELNYLNIDNKNYSKTKLELLFKSYARNQGSQVSTETIKKDMLSHDQSKMDTDTILKYINYLKTIFVIDDVEAFNPNLRSKTVIRSSPTRYFQDPSLATASLNINPKLLKNDLETLGLLFETLAIRDLRVYMDVIGGKVYHYRDSSDLECDAVVVKDSGEYGLIEVKLGGLNAIDYGASNLIKLSSRIDTEYHGSPSFLMVLTALGDKAYRRKDGVYVVPISALKN